ncbi:hypothetical protein Marpi_0028 [Marinitoga piezophila KA3]|uniref:Activator of Hsp90 ATPase homologue 1/2-like C-terminal domain-containing protein n=1 Tax=Marinitoga piezophila (strain DSM 14283 / JCM 11233 / KA3) TaxID=443254 RepID=H2J2P4_MARPK|nr:SRPBCC domain-containing protein [Marinitoga piezophila]AEX84488.1 hypothetical protein Marpi_0028 [Marinitoga piezophila KA3]
MVETPPIEIIEYFNAPIEKVWNVFVNENGWSPWFTDKMYMELRNEGKITFLWKQLTLGEIVEDEGYIEEIIDKRLIIFWWYKEERGYRSKVEMSFSKDENNGTWLKIIDYTQVYTLDELQIKYGCALGWGQMLNLAKLWIEKGITII